MTTLPQQTSSLPATAVFTPGRLPDIYARQHKILRAVQVHQEVRGEGLPWDKATRRWARRDLADLVVGGFLRVTDGALLEVAQ